MFSHTQTFYNKSIRNIVIAFGSLFESIYIIRNDENGVEDKKIRVPFEYGNKEKFIWSLTKETTGRIQITLPRMGFELTNIVYDPTRKSNRLNLKTSYVNGVYKKVFSEVPYNIGFSVYVFTRHMDDMLQIVEQILPYFAPEFTVTLNMNELNKKVDVPIVLNSMNVIEDYEGDFETRRSVNTVFDFTMKTYVYGPIKNDIYLIDDFELNLFEGATMGNNTKVYSGGWTGNIATLSGITAYENP